MPEINNLDTREAFEQDLAGIEDLSILLRLSRQAGEFDCTDVLLARLAAFSEPEIVSFIDSDGNRALHLAAMFNCPPLLRYLLEHGCRPMIDTSNDEGLTALHLAVLSCNADSVALLCAFGANRDIRDNACWQTPEDKVYQLFKTHGSAFASSSESGVSDLSEKKQILFDILGHLQKPTQQVAELSPVADYYSLIPPVRERIGADAVLPEFIHGYFNKQPDPFDKAVMKKIRFHLDEYCRGVSTPASPVLNRLMWAALYEDRAKYVWTILLLLKIGPRGPARTTLAHLLDTSFISELEFSSAYKHFSRSWMNAILRWESRLHGFPWFFRGNSIHPAAKAVVRRWKGNLIRDLANERQDIFNREAAPFLLKIDNEQASDVSQIHVTSPQSSSQELELEDVADAPFFPEQRHFLETTRDVDLLLCMADEAAQQGCTAVLIASLAALPRQKIAGYVGTIENRALHYAAAAGNAPLLSWLLEEVCAPVINAGNQDGNTALHMAAVRGHEACVALLCAFGADRKIRNNFWQTPQDQAQIELNKIRNTIAHEELLTCLPRVSIQEQRMLNIVFYLHTSHAHNINTPYRARDYAFIPAIQHRIRAHALLPSDDPHSVWGLREEYDISVRFISIFSSIERKIKLHTTNLFTDSPGSAALKTLRKTYDSIKFHEFILGVIMLLSLAPQKKSRQSLTRLLNVDFIAEDEFPEALKLFTDKWMRIVLTGKAQSIISKRRPLIWHDWRAKDAVTQHELDEAKEWVVSTQETTINAFAQEQQLRYQQEVAPSLPIETLADKCRRVITISDKRCALFGRKPDSLLEPDIALVAAETYP